MAQPLLLDDLWAIVEPLLPAEPPKPKGGQPRVSDRAALTGILFVLKSGIPWELLPAEMGCGSGVTYWRRLRDGQEAGVWDRLHQTLPGSARRGEPDWLGAVEPGQRQRPGKKRGVAVGPNPTDRRQRAFKEILEGSLSSVGID